MEGVSKCAYTRVAAKDTSYRIPDSDEEVSDTEDATQDATQDGAELNGAGTSNASGRGRGRGRGVRGRGTALRGRGRGRGRGMKRGAPEPSGGEEGEATDGEDSSSGEESEAPSEGEEEVSDGDEELEALTAAMAPVRRSGRQSRQPAHLVDFQH